MKRILNWIVKPVDVPMFAFIPMVGTAALVVGCGAAMTYKELTNDEYKLVGIHCMWNEVDSEEEAGVSDPVLAAACNYLRDKDM